MKNKPSVSLSALILAAFLVGCGGASSGSSSSLETSSVSEVSSERSIEETSSAPSSSEEASSSSNEESSSTVSSSSSKVVSSSQESSIPDYVLFGLFQGESAWKDKAMEQNPYASTEYMIKGITLHEDDLFKIHMRGDTWYGYSALKSSVPSGLVTRGPSDDNIKVLVTGTYDIYSNYNESDGGHIYLARTDVDPTASSSTGTVKVTGITLDRAGKFMEPRHEYVLTATISPSNATNKEIYWSSSDTSVATVTRGGRIVAVAKGSATITAKTADGGKTATCLVYVSPSGIPDYYLTGTINGRSYGYGSYIYAGIPLGSGEYFIPDVELKDGDELKVMGSNGATLKDKNNQTYTYKVKKDMSVHVYLDIYDSSKNYLSFENK